MFRPTTLLNAAKNAATYRTASLTASRITPIAARFYASSNANIEVRVLDILRGFDKVDESKVKTKKREKDSALK